MTVTNTCSVYIVRRNDGVTLGFTDLDESLTVDGVECAPAGGFDASSIESRIGASVDTIDAEGFISHERITESDLLDGVYDGATVELREIDWKTGDVLRRWPPYVVAEVEASAPMITLRLEQTAALHANRAQGLTTSGTCPHTLGDAKCALDLAPYEQAATIAATDGRDWIEVSGLVQPAVGQWFGGLIRIAGNDYEIRRFEGERLTVYGPMAGAVAGASVSLAPGCAKAWSACQAFGNTPNFGGFPFIPGEDVLTNIASPTDGVEYDGGSLFG